MRQHHHKKTMAVRLQMLNRMAVILRPKAPLLAWLKSIPDLQMGDMTLDELRSDDQTVFLLPDYDYLDDTRAHLKKIFKPLFEVELEGWWRNPDDYPENMTYEMFEEWFDVELNSMVVDTTGNDFEVMDL